MSIGVEEPTVLRDILVSKKSIRILITGATGLLGRALVQQFYQYDVTALGFSRVKPEEDGVTLAPSRPDDPRSGLLTWQRCDLSDPEAIRAVFHKVQPHVIVHSAAERRPDVVEKSEASVRQLNVDATALLAELAHSRDDCFLLLISTDYVFDGTQPPYKPNAAPNPLNKYGLSKLQAERALLDSPHHGGVLRVPVLYGRAQDLAESAITCMLEPLLAAHRRGEPFKVDHWAKRVPTLVDDVALVCLQIVERRLRHCSLSGVWHWSGPDHLTKYELCLLMARHFGLPTEFIVPDEEPPKDNIRPRDAQLDTSTLFLMGIGKKTPFSEGLPYVLADHPELLSQIQQQ